MDKETVLRAIETRVCKHCENYNHGEYSKPCGTCKVSVCCMTIDLLFDEQYPPYPD